MQFDRLKRREIIGLLGGAAAWPLAARAQQPVMPVIGFLGSRSPDESAYLLLAFHKGLADGGYVEGQNVAIEFRWAWGQYDRLPALAMDLVRRKVDVLAVFGPPAARAAQAATTTVPIVFSTGEDPVKSGLVSSLARPGGNITGLSFITAALGAKRLGLLQELIPKAELIALIVNRTSEGADQSEDVHAAARQIGRRVLVQTAATDAELDLGFATAVQQKAGALMVGADPFFDTQRDRIVALAARHGMPAMYHVREFPAAGGLISYGTNLPSIYRQVGGYVARVLKGQRPADLPVLQPTSFDLVINLKTARALGLEVPPTLLARADEVIE
jgi:putative ABC transport system substrate-binding protein